MMLKKTNLMIGFIVLILAIINASEIVGQIERDAGGNMQRVNVP